MRYTAGTLSTTLLIILSFPVQSLPLVTHDLVAYYDFEGHALDTVGSHHGTVHGNTNFAAGKLGQSAYFDGSGDYIETSTFNDTWANWTTSFYIKPSAGSSGHRTIMERERIGSFNDFEVRVASNSKIQTETDAASATSMFSNKSITNDKWHHVSITYDGTNQKTYIDGALDNTIDQSNAHVNVAAPLNIGRHVNPNSPIYFDGGIDEIAIYDSALSASEINQNYEFYENVISGNNYLIKNGIFNLETGGNTIEVNEVYSEFNQLVDSDTQSKISVDGATAFKMIAASDALTILKNFNSGVVTTENIEGVGTTYSADPDLDGGLANLIAFQRDKAVEHMGIIAITNAIKSGLTTHLANLLTAQGTSPLEIALEIQDSIAGSFLSPETMALLIGDTRRIQGMEKLARFNSIRDEILAGQEAGESIPLSKLEEAMASWSQGTTFIREASSFYITAVPGSADLKENAVNVIDGTFKSLVSGLIDGLKSLFIKEAPVQEALQDTKDLIDLYDGLQDITSWIEGGINAYGILNELEPYPHPFQIDSPKFSTYAEIAIEREFTNENIITEQQVIDFSEDNVAVTFEGPGDGKIIDDLENSYAALETRSPIYMDMIIDTSDDSFLIYFDYQFLTASGILDVLIDDMLIGSWDSSAVSLGSWSSASFWVSNQALFGLSNANLRFAFDGPAGSKINIDNIRLGTVDLKPVPEPETLFLLVLGLTLIVMTKKKRKMGDYPF